MAKVNEANILAVLTRGSWLLLAVMSLAGLFVSPQFAASIMAGGLLALANFYWLRSILQRLVMILPESPQRFVLLRYLIRLTLMAVAIYLLIVKFGVSVFGMVIGLSVLVCNIVAMSLYMLTTKGE